jgi:hypothetical protein
MMVQFVAGGEMFKVNLEMEQILRVQLLSKPQALEQVELLLQYLLERNLPV